jgi:hypothetical protein
VAALGACSHMSFQHGRLRITTSWLWRLDGTRRSTSTPRFAFNSAPGLGATLSRVPESLTASLFARPAVAYVVRMGANSVNGRKRHILVDTGDFVLRPKIHPADIQNRGRRAPAAGRCGRSVPRIEHI